MASKRPADRDLVEQLIAVRELAAQMPISLDDAVDALFLRQGDAAVQSAALCGADTVFELGDGLAAGSQPRRRLYQDEHIQAQLAWARTLRGETGSVVLHALEQAHKLGPMRALPLVGSALEMEQLRQDFPNCSQVVDFVWGRAMLCCMAPTAVMRLPPILLDGPPGTGKTAFCARLAKWLRVPIHHVDIPMMEASFKITGLDAGYSSGKPGAIWNALQGPSMAPVVVLDELDKPAQETRHSGLGCLLGLLEPSTAARFKDSCVGLPVDASRVMWLATSNDASSIDAALLSRLRVFRVAAPTAQQMRAVIGSVWRSMRQSEEWAAAFPEVLPDVVLERLQGHTPRELRHAVEDASMRAASAGRCALLVEDLPASPPRPGRAAMGFLP